MKFTNESRRSRRGGGLFFVPVDQRRGTSAEAGRARELEIPPADTRKISAPTIQWSHAGVELPLAKASTHGATKIQMPSSRFTHSCPRTKRRPMAESATRKTMTPSTQASQAASEPLPPLAPV